MKGSKCEPATKEELAWIKKLQAVCDNVPNKKLWLFSASGALCVMKTPEDGEEHGGFSSTGVNQDNVIGHIRNMRNDGGDW